MTADISQIHNMINVGGTTTFGQGKEHLRFTNYGMTVFWSDTMVAGDIKEFPARDVVAAGRGTTDQQLIDFRDFVK